MISNISFRTLKQSYNFEGTYFIVKVATGHMKQQVA